MGRKTLVTLVCLALFASLVVACAPTDEERVPGEGGAHMGSEQDVTAQPLVGPDAESDPGFATVEPTLPGPLQTVVHDVVSDALFTVYGGSVLTEGAQGDGPNEGTLTYAVPYLLTESQAEILFQELMARGAWRGDPEADEYECEESSVGFCVEMDVSAVASSDELVWIQVDLDIDGALIHVGHGAVATP